MQNKIFVADYEYEKQNESELSYQVGDNIRILYTEGEWCYGEHTVTNEVGWVAPSYGHTRASSSPYDDLNDAAKLTQRKPKFNSVLSSENEFLKMLKVLIDTVITPLTLRDTNFKRSFLGDPSVGLSVSLLDEIYNASTNFLNLLNASKNEIDISKAYLGFAPSLQLFAQYASENSKLLNALKGHNRQLQDFLSKSSFPVNDLIESYLVLPLQHYPKYKVQFQEFVWLTPNSAGTEAILSLQSGLDAVIAQSDYVDSKLDEEKESLLLLNLQNQCKFYLNNVYLSDM